MRKSEYPKDTETLGKRIRKKRMDLGKSLLEVAKASGITEGYLSRIEADKQMPGPKVAHIIADVLDDNPYDYARYALLKLYPQGKNDNFFKNEKTLKAKLKKYNKTIENSFPDLPSKEKEKLKDIFKKELESLFYTFTQENIFRKK